MLKLKTVYLKYREFDKVYQGIFVNVKTIDIEEPTYRYSLDPLVTLDTLHGIRVFNAVGPIKIETQPTK